MLYFGVEPAVERQLWEDEYAGVMTHAAPLARSTRFWTVAKAFLRPM